MSIEIEITRGLDLRAQVMLAAQAVRQGEIILFPTETVYGLAADASNPEAIERLFTIKHRPANKPFPVMVSSLEMARELVDLGDAQEIARDYWPGPLTLVLPAKNPGFSPACVQDGTIGIRCPHHDVAQAILELAGVPLAVPSANASGEPPATDSAQARYVLANSDIAFRIYQQNPTMGQPTTVLKIEPHTWTILRHGPVSADAIRGYLPPHVTLA